MEKLQDRPLSKMQIAEAAYSALVVTRRMSGGRLREWNMTPDSARIAFLDVGVASLDGGYSERDERLVEAVKEALRE